MVIAYEYMPKVSADVPQELLDDVQTHVGDDAKFVSTSDAIRSALRKMLDQMDRVDERRGRAGDGSEDDTR